MGILDSVVSALNAGSSAGPTGPAVSVANELINILRSQGGAGGLSGLLQSFESGGLGHVFQSWIGNGQNLPVSADQISSVLANSGLLQRLSQATGLPPADVAQHLSTLLPQIIDHLTPNGQLHPGDVGSALEGLAQRFLRG